MKHIIISLILLSVSFSYISCTRVDKGRSINKQNRRELVNNRANSKTPNKRKERSIETMFEASSNNRKMTGTEIFEKYESAVFMIYTSDGVNSYQGSGFFIDEKGTAISNYHVFEGTNQGQEIIQLSNGEQYKIKRVLSKSSDNDNIVFEVNNRGDRFNYIPIEEENTKVGEKVYAIGSPKGLENTFSSGEISQIRGNTVYQISVPITHGSSGGALINEYGKVIGITTSGLAEAGAILNFAININAVKL